MSLRFVKKESTVPAYKQYGESFRLISDIFISRNRVDFRNHIPIMVKDYNPFATLLRVNDALGKEIKEVRYSEADPKKVTEALTFADQNRYDVHILNTGWGGGSIILFNGVNPLDRHISRRTAEVHNYLIAPIRSSGTKVWPDSLGLESGIGNATDPIASVLKEATEEIVITTNDGKLLVPSFYNENLRRYNDQIKRNLSHIASAFGLEAAEIPVRQIFLNAPHFLNNTPIRIAINYNESNKGEHARAGAFDIVLEPILYSLSAYNSKASYPIAFRDTIGVETGGRVPERRIMAANLENGVVEVFHKGARIGSYGSFKAFINDNTYILDSRHPVIPAFAVMVHSLMHENQLQREMRDLGVFANYDIPYANRNA